MLYLRVTSNGFGDATVYQVSQDGGLESTYCGNSHFFAHGMLNYGCIMPAYLADMEALKHD